MRTRRVIFDTSLLITGTITQKNPVLTFTRAAYWLFCSGVISSLIAGATILGEEVDPEENEDFDHLKKPSLVLTGTDNDAFSTESASISGEESTNM
jgi:hypothetical protein